MFLHLNGILRPTRGTVRFAGRDVRYDHTSLMDLRRNVGIVFQDPDTQIFSASVVQEVSFGPLNMGLPRDQVQERVQRALEAAYSWADCVYVLKDGALAGQGTPESVFQDEGESPFHPLFSRNLFPPLSLSGS
ncbi:MAG: ATP-binding cassette domain-containing protein [Desulfocucumaceae bacterium]